jgi:hypothetical protein
MLSLLTGNTWYDFRPTEIQNNKYVIDKIKYLIIYLYYSNWNPFFEFI